MFPLYTLLSSEPYYALLPGERKTFNTSLNCFAFPSISTGPGFPLGPGREDMHNELASCLPGSTHVLGFQVRHSQVSRVRLIICCASVATIVPISPLNNRRPNPAILGQIIIVPTCLLNPSSFLDQDPRLSSSTVRDNPSNSARILISPCFQYESNGLYA